MAFDVQGALKAGYSPAEIADFLGSENNFDVAGARKAGYKDDELVSHLTQLGKKEPTPEKPGIIAREIDRTTDAGGSDVGSEIMAVAGPKATSGYKSVLETQAPTAADQQAEIDKRLAYGAGPVSQKTVAQADLVRSGLAKPANIQEQRVAEEMQRRKRLAPETGVFGQALPDQNEVSFGDLLETAKTRNQAEEDAGRGELDYLGSSLQRGWNGLNLAVNGQKLADYGELLDSFTKAYTPEQIAADPKLQEELRVRQEGFAKLAQENAQLTKTNEEILASSRTRPETKLMMGVGTKDRGWVDSAAAFGAAMIRDPGSVVDLALSSGPSSLASMATAAITYFGTRNPALAAAAGGAGSGYVEFGNEYSDNRASGMSHDDAWKAAAMKAGVVGALDAVSMRTAGKALDTISEALQTGATKTALKTVGKETLKQGALGGLGEAGGSFAAGKAIDPTSVLSEVVGEMVSAPAEAVSTRGTLAKAITPEAQFARAFEQDVANTQFTGTQTVARNLLDPNSYDARMINPAQTVDTSKISQATTVDEAIAAAHEAAGEVKPPVMPAFTAPVPPAVGPSEPTLAPMAFNAPVPAALGGRIEPTFDLNAPLTAAPIAPTQGLSPALPRLTERAPDLDLLNRVETQTSGLVAPRPQKIQGVAVSQLSDGQLKTIAADETVPAITRRGASVELTARQAETPAPTPLTGPATPPSVPLPNAPAIVDNTLTLPASEAALPAIAATPVGGQLASDTARATAQTALDRWAASSGVATPAQLTPAPAGLDAAVNGIAQALNSQFGGRIYAYNDTRPNNLNGLAIGGVGFINTYQPAVNVGRTSLHEFKHTVEQIATLETRQGLTNTPAQKFVTQIDSIFDEMDDAGKRSYIENFLHQDELAGIADPVAREQRLQQLMQSPDTRSEMTADFLGNRATDKKFWKDVAEADPVGFKAFVDKWLSIIDNVLEALKGRRNQSTKESAQVDRYVRDLNKAKAVARDALIEYSKATRGTENGIPTTTGREGLPELAASARPELAESGGGQVPEYGTPRAGAVSVLGRHYSNESRTTLSGAYYGRGLKGAERDRLDSSPDPRLKNRIYFYVDQGFGVRPEAGVGGVAHEVRLNNIYNPESRVIKPASNFNAWESAVINAGFDGYMAPFGNNQAAVVLLGSRHSAVPVRSLGRVAGAPAPTPAAPTTLKKGLLSREAAAVDVTRIPGAQVRVGNLEIPAGERTAANTEMERIGSEVRFSKKAQKAAPARVMFEVAPNPNDTELNVRWDAVPFERKIEISQRVATKIMPQVFRLAGVRAKMATQLGGYLEKTSPSFAAILPSTASAEQLMDVARLGGFGLTQEEMMVLDSKPFKGSSLAGLITVTLPENMQDQESVHSVYQAIRQVSLENIKGHTTVGQEMVLVVPSDRMTDLVSKIEGVLGSRPEGFIINAAEGQSAFVANTEYDYDSENGNLAPELLAKRTEARRIREEASAAIEEELAKDESTGGRQIDTGVYRSVADAFGLSQTEYNASALPLMLGGVKDKIFRAPKIGGIPETIQWLDQRYRDSGMPTLDINKAEDRATLAKLMAAEAVGAIRSAGNAVEWYDETIDKMLTIMSVKYPELNTDPDARNAFLIAVAISSQKMDVESNLTFASSQYEAFRETLRKTGIGKFPEIGQGTAIPAMVKNFALANKVMADMGPTLLRRFLQTEFTKRELETVGFKIGGESMDEKVLGSAIFGPKIGFGFYSNLTGNFEPITMDMWFMRFVGRLSGTLLAFDPVLFPKQVAKLRAALSETGDSNRGVYASDFKPEEVAAAQETDEGAIALARKIYSLHNRQFTKQRAAFDSGARIKTALVGAASSIIKSADKPTDAPGSGGERQRLRDVTRQMVALVEQQAGKRVPPAALQALVWYPEQELYKKLGVDLPVTSQDYAGAAELLLTKEGFDEKQISAAAQSGPRPARQVAGKQNAGTAGQAGQPTRPTGPIQGTERESFIQARTPLKDIFAGLEKRGLAKARAEAAFTSHPKGPQIRFVEDQFLDILAELEDSGQIKINCK